MKHMTLTTILSCCILMACEAGPQRSDRRDSTRIAQSPATKRLRPDSPATTTMPVIRTDTARQADMPIAVPPNNVQPK